MSGMSHSHGLTGGLNS